MLHPLQKISSKSLPITNDAYPCPEEMLHPLQKISSKSLPIINDAYPCPEEMFHPLQKISSKSLPITNDAYPCPEEMFRPLQKISSKKHYNYFKIMFVSKKTNVIHRTNHYAATRPRVLHALLQLGLGLQMLHHGYLTVPILFNSL